jgi:hypothetical protein
VEAVRVWNGKSYGPMGIRPIPGLYPYPILKKNAK